MVATVLKGAVELVLEFVPNMDLPRICGFYSSPMGEVVYQIASMQFSEFNVAPEGAKIDFGKISCNQLLRSGGGGGKLSFSLIEPEL